MFSPYLKLSRANFLFPLALVLFEFSVYICNDMVQPAMLVVTREFMVDSSWVPLSMTAFLVGGASLPWLAGPWSDRVGRRPVLLAGVAYFTLTCLATYLVDSIHTFMLLRILQGIGLCFINTVGYAAVQEAFEEKVAVKTMALMANIALIAPLLGPLAGALLLDLAPWRTSFLLIAMLSFIALLGLFWKMPETIKPSREKLLLSVILRDYWQVFSQRRFMLSAALIPLLALPLLGWIALSPVFLIEDLAMTSVQYGWMQLPVFTGLIAGNLILALVAERWPLGRSVLLGMWPIVLGLLLLLGGVYYSSFPQYYLMAGMSLMALGEGLAFGVLYRFALMSSDVAGKGTIAASMSMLGMAGYALGLELFRWAYLHGGMLGFALLCCVFSLSYILLARRSVGVVMAERAEQAL
ncbi:MFS transporter [Neisseriaceae bacterium TC5R-5]|nr:MFS transporter [Neisseriaceae bacterium TC5R-5]